VSERRQVLTHTDAVPDTAALIEGLRRFERLAELRASRFYAAHRDALDRLLATPLEGGPAASVLAAPPAALRIVHWNIEKGLRLDGIERQLEAHPGLERADVIMLNEVDLGMARSGNCYVARELGERLGMHWAFAPAHLELTKGIGTDLEVPGENAVGIQGNAILSRHSLERARVVELPVCFEPYHFHEKRYGRRVGIVAEVETRRGPLVLAGAHLEVRNTPACRARQTRALVDALPRRGPAIIAGDFNASTFARGTIARTLKGTARLLGDEEHLRASLRDVPAREPLFLELRRGGFRIEGWNTDDITIVEQIGGLEDARHLPGPVRRRVLARLDRLGRQLEFRLDWFAGRDVIPRNPLTVAGLVDRDGGPVSDHAPIVVDVEC
jgi:endonuclease/exonuclease/phosphatase family metal-dependent hydrolase